MAGVQPRRLPTVGENVPEMLICIKNAELYPFRSLEGVDMLDNIPAGNGLRKTRPPGTRIILVRRTEKGLPRYYIHVDAFLVIVPVLVPVRRLRTVTPGNIKLHPAKLLH